MIVSAATALLMLASHFEGCSISSKYIRPDNSLGSSVQSGESGIVESIFLIGDAGEQVEGMQEPVLASLQNLASVNSSRNTIVFLGDNIYRDGMPDESNSERPRAERRINEQLKVVRQSGAEAIFIPGNHDWGSWDGDGVASLRRQDDFIKRVGGSKVRTSPVAGTPGPDVLDIGTDLRLVTLDTEWWLHQNPKPLYPNASTEQDTKAAFIDSLSHALISAGKRNVIVVGHHPLDAHGEHSGFFDWRDHLFPLRNVAPWLWLPLPGIGSLYPFIRNHGVSNQDFSSAAYQEMKGRIEGVFSKIPPLSYVSGHEHTLEVLNGPGQYLLLVSGYGTSEHSPSLTVGENTIFADRHSGFMRLDFLANGHVRLGVVEPANDRGEPAEVFSRLVR